MVSISGRPLSGTSPLYPRSAGGGTGAAFRMFGRRRMSKLRFRVLVVVYLTMGCIIPYYVMKYAEEEQLYQEGPKFQQEQEQSYQQQHYGVVNQMPDKGPIAADPNNPRGYRRRAFFQDLNEIELSSIPLHSAYQPEQLDPILYPSQPLDQGKVPASSPPSSSSSFSSTVSRDLQLTLQRRLLHQQEILANLTQTFALQRQLAKLHKVKSEKNYTSMIQRALTSASKWILKKIPQEFQYFETRIPGTALDTVEKTKRFRQLMDQALNKGRWVYEPHRGYPDFGGATGWNKKMKNERDRDAAIDRPPFPEAGKYHWEPIVDLPSSSVSSPSPSPNPLVPPKGWHADRIHPQDFCRILGPRHIVLVGDLIHWQLHDSIMYNMFDTPQACYGDLACSLGVGHPICPLPNNVRLKFVRNDLLSSIRPRNSGLDETKTHDPVEMPWLKDMRLKDTVILGATHQTMTDNLFLKGLADTLAKIRKIRPEALIIYRNNPVGHPDCPSKTNEFNNDAKRRQVASDAMIQQQQVQQQQQEPKKSLGQSTFKGNSNSNSNSNSANRPKKKQGKPLLMNNRTTFSAPARPFDHDIPLAEMLDYPLNWIHYDRQNHMAKKVVEASGGIYWNVATMTNMRPDGHVGGQDCLSYKRPGPTDEWAVSLYNLFKTIELVERELGDSS
ncbi:hypothetical protein EDD21DRAFT_433513 [Dissophora ornata]|nr:hypothetical protein EDD21DRAFT_433513 [Dissophora ornata]